MHKKITYLLFSCLFLLMSSMSTAFASPQKSVRGVWISTVANIDYPTRPTTDAYALKKEAETMLNRCKDMGINTVFLQVRPCCDAYYKSSIYPWSEFLTGSQGIAPEDGFDPLTYWVSEAHQRGIELHAWINPYRVTRNGYNSDLNSLADASPAKQHPEYCIRYSNGNYFFNPAMPEVRRLLVDGALEIVKNYDVDGIHMDDYFYPGEDIDDAADYAAYGGPLSLEDWRRENVNILVKMLHDEIKALDPGVEFGISPCGVWDNGGEYGSNTRGMSAYSQIYADTRKWALEGWLDYICPQVYWEIGNYYADYETVTKWWADTLQNSPTKLYIGMAAYRIADAQPGEIWYDGTALSDEFLLNETIPKVSGEVMFTYSDLDDNPLIYNIVSEHFNGEEQSELVAQAEAVAEPGLVYEDSEIVTEDIQPETEELSEPVTEEIVSETVIKEELVEETTFDVNRIVNTDKVKVLVYVDGQKIDFAEEPVVINGRTMVPLRGVFEAIGSSVDWNNSDRRVTALRDRTKVSLVIGVPEISVNDSSKINLDVAPIIRNNYTFIPLRAVSESFGLEVGWNNSNRVVTISTR